MRRLQNFYLCRPFPGVETMPDLRCDDWNPEGQPLSWSRRFQGCRTDRIPARAAYPQDPEKGPFIWRTWTTKGPIHGVDQGSDLTPANRHGSPAFMATLAGYCYFISAEVVKYAWHRAADQWFFVPLIRDFWFVSRSRDIECSPFIRTPFNPRYRNICFLF